MGCLKPAIYVLDKGGGEEDMAYTKAFMVFLHKTLSMEDVDAGLVERLYVKVL